MKNIMSSKITKAVLIVVTVIALLVGSAVAQAQDDLRAEIEAIKKQLTEMDSLKTRLDDLEKKLAESEKVREEMKKTQESQLPVVTTSFKESKARIDGRIFVGVFDTGDQGNRPNWSTDINDARLRFTFVPSKYITIVNRLRTSGADVNGFDYFYLDYTRTPLPWGILRLGQRKIDVGQETWVDNPVENILISNSVSAVSGYGTGIALRGRFSKSSISPVYEVGYVNGPRGVMARPTNSIPFNIKVGAPLPDKFFASTSYFDSGDLRPENASAISVANLTNAPAGALGWNRKLWEVDLRYNYGPEGIRNLIPNANISGLMFGATYGTFWDNAVGVPDRDGSYWFVESLYNLSRRFYSAARYSTVDLRDNILANLGNSPVPVNEYNRLSLGLGYRLSNLADVKTEYSFNDTSGGAIEPSLNQWAVGVATKF